MDPDRHSLSAPLEPKAARALALRLLRDITRGLGWRYAGFVAATLGFGLVLMLPPELFRLFTQGAQSLSDATALEFLRKLAVFGGLTAGALFLTNLGGNLLEEWMRLKVEADLRGRVLERLHRMPLESLDGIQRGDWLARVTGELGQVENFLAEAVPGQIRQVAILLGAGSLFVVHTGGLALIPLGAAVVLAIVNLRMQKKLWPVLAELRTLHGGVFQLILESLEGLRTVRSHGAEPYVRSRFDAKTGEITVKSLRVVRSIGFLLGGNELIGQLMITACLSAVAWGLARGELTLQGALFYPFFVGMFYGAAQGLAGQAYDWNRFFTEGGRLGQVIYEGESKIATVAPATGCWSDARELSVSGLYVGHRGRIVAGPLDFRLRRGELRAVTGPSGAGKTTLLEVLAGLRTVNRGHGVLYDGSGNGLWGNGARPGTRFPLGPCAFVEQRPYIFEGTLRDNLTFENPARVSDDELWEYLAMVGLESFARRNGGFDYFLHDRGRNLSEGERYRVALCRALLLKRPFLLLDEPFAALDVVSIGIVVRTLRRLREKAGILIVTHYLPRYLDVQGVVKVGDGVEPVEPLLHAHSRSTHRPLVEFS